MWVKALHVLTKFTKSRDVNTVWVQKICQNIQLNKLLLKKKLHFDQCWGKLSP